MSDTILIDFSNPSSIEWAKFSDGQQQEKGHVDAITEMTEIAKNHTLIVWIAGEHVTLSSLTVPSEQQRHLRRILPSLLEDGLASDIEQLHFAKGDVDNNGNVTVAVIEQDILDDVMVQFSQANLKPALILPDSLSIPQQGDEWSLSVDGAISQLRAGPQTTHVFDTQNLATFLSIMTYELSPTLNLYASNKTQSNLEIDYPYKWQGIVIDKLAQLPDKSLIALNLLQGDYASQNNVLKYWRQWRSVVSLVIATLLIQLGGVMFETKQLNDTVVSHKKDIKTVFHSAFPDEKRIVNAKAQMSQRIAKLQSKQDNTGFLMLLQQLAPALKQSKEIKLMRMNFEHRLGEMRIDIKAQDYSQLERVKSAVSQLGFEVELGSVSSNKGAYTGKLMIRGQQ